MSNIRDNYPALRYIDEYEKDNSKECKRCKGECGYIGIIGEWACQGFVPMTNADRIRAMSDKELADEILRWFNWLNAVEWDDTRILNWLKQESGE